MKFVEKWKTKSLWSKITDFIFIALIISLIIPSSRTEVMGIVNRVKAYFISPSVIEDTEAKQISEQSYNWALQDINGENVNMNESSGKVIFINNWATWCGPCVGEMPEIQKLYNEFKDNSEVEFYLISNEPLEKLKSFLENRGYNFPVYRSLQAAPGAFSSNSIPTTFIISRKGKIVVHETGAKHWSGNRTVNLIKKLIEEK